MDYPRLTKVTRKGQVTIPEEIREAYGISEGDFMLVGGTKGLVMLKKLSLPSWKELFLTLIIRDAFLSSFANSSTLPRE
jgi:AbrB family looped-hinge helix DNA binding protein